jgi:membrane-associated phospholipid phosphatase
MKNFLYSIPKNIIDCFKNYWIWHTIAIVLTFILVTTNTDWYYFINTRSNTLMYIFAPAMVLGGILPFIIPLYLIAGGYFTKQRKNEILGWAILQAAFIGSVISSFYKVFTGRIQPNLQNITNNISWDFQFGLLRHGIFWGWPSSHTTVAFAMAFTLIGLFPKNKIIKFLSIFYALYIGIGVSFSIHWFSECIAGAIIGTIIGIVVAKSYKKKLNESSALNVNLS